MNLNRFKKGFTSTNPERGLHNLPGAIKSERHDEGPSVVRVKGRYIPQDNDRAGQFFGIMGYIHAWIYVILLPCTIFAKDSLVFNPLSVFLTGLVIVHGCALAADGLRNSDAPWARKGIKIFWLASLVFLLTSILLGVIL